jgi:hypothetical protein
MTKFTTRLIEKSKADNLAEAVKEWYHVKTLKEDGHCICAMKLKYLYVIKNRENQNTLTVGSDCIKKFMKCLTADEFDGVKAKRKFDEYLFKL